LGRLLMEEFMRSRWAALILGLYLSTALLACSSKPTGANGDNSAADNTANNSTAAPAQPAAPAPQPVVIPAGTMLTIRLGQTVGSKVSQTGETFSATLAKPVEVGGQPAIPSGATVSGTVVDAKALGHFAGGARLALRLTSINLNGADQPISIAEVVRVIKGKGKRTGIMAGGGAALGAIIGGIAGGGKGAAIGAVAGGGAGTAGGALTGNKEIVFPAESVLSFKLERPLELK
jgi:hypothetical protein